MCVLQQRCYNKTQFQSREKITGTGLIKTGRRHLKERDETVQCLASKALKSRVTHIPSGKEPVVTDIRDVYQ